jgi:heterodisulfide reductase subunit B
VNAALAAGDLHYEPGSLAIRHLLDVIVHDIGLEAVAQRVVRPLTGLRVAPYLGCMVPRPDYEHRWSDHEHPVELDRLLEALGAEVIDFPLKTHCCGGHMPHIGPATAFELIRRLVSSAESHGADLMATLCPMCQLNVDAYQGEMNRYFHTHHQVPILFFTQLMGFAFGADAGAVGIGREFVSAREALDAVGTRPPTPPSVKPRRSRKDTSLPMPRPRHPAPGATEVEP